IQEGSRDTEDLAGLFSGYQGNGETGTYDAREGHWGYEGSSCDGNPPRAKMLKAAHGIQGHDLQAGAPSHSGSRKDMTDAPGREPPPAPSSPTRPSALHPPKAPFATPTP